jgi:hypothetical protein
LRSGWTPAQRKKNYKGNEEQMVEKDKFGDTLREKGKGDEDRWVAEQERKRLERLRETAAQGSGTCPRDGAALVPQKANLITMAVCHRNELEVAVRQDNEGAVIHWVRSLFEA